MLPEITAEEFSAVLDSVVADVIRSLPDAAPPIDALDLAHSLGLAVAWDDRQTGRGRIVRLRGFCDRSVQESILLKPDPRRERMQWAVAHEIGEAHACEVFTQLGVDPREAPSGAREMVANHLAGRLLLPEPWFGVDGSSCGWDLLELKSRYRTASHELIARRMLDFGPPVVITIFDHGRRTFRRGNLAGRLPPLVASEIEAWRESHEQGEVATHSNHLCTVRVWPVHEPDWKREIIRTEWHAGEDELS
jgi:Zn-dependent peptidase ImmA (M78 family)